MIPVSNGLAKFKIDKTNEIITVAADDLDWQQNGGDERQMGAELRYEAEYEFSSPTIGGSYIATWELYEYPIGCENYKNFEVSSGISVIQNVDFGLEHEEEFDE